MSDMLTTEMSLKWSHKSQPWSNLSISFCVCLYMFLVNLVQKVRLYYFFVYLGFIYQIQSIDILSRYLCFNVEMLFSLNCRWFLHDDDATNNLLRLPSVPLVFGTWSVHAHCTRVWLISDNAVPLTLRYSLLYVLIKYLILGPVLFFFFFLLRICYPQQHRKMHNSGF